MKKETPKKVVPRNFLTYLSMIKGSVGSHAYREQWAIVNGKKTNIAGAGDTSCGFFVSFILVGFKYISDIHATVSGVERDLELSGWKKISKPKEGAVIVWEGLLGKTGVHTHIGFWLNEKQTISNSSSLGCPKIHHPTYGTKNGMPKRKIIAIYWKKGLEKT